MSDQLFTTEPQDVLSQLVGEGKKYATPEDLARSRLKADEFIDTLKAENRQLREEAAARAKLEDMIDRLSQRQIPEPTPQDNPPEKVTKVNEAPNVEELVKKVFDQRYAEEIAQTNLNKVTEYVKQTFGEDYETKFKARLSELALSSKEAQALAINNPNAFIRILGQAPQKPMDTGAPPRGEVNLGFKPQGTARDMTYYNELKARDPAAYNSQKVQIQMHRDALELGERFFT